MSKNDSSRTLACIPLANSVRNRIAALIAEARKLRILLRTAEQLEREELRKKGLNNER